MSGETCKCGEPLKGLGAQLRGTCNFCDLIESQQPPQGHTSGGWPLRSEALACHPDQIPEITERNKKHGVTGVSYDPIDGTAIIDSRQERKKLLKVEGFHDKQGGYGD